MNDIRRTIDLLEFVRNGSYIDKKILSMSSEELIEFMENISEDEYNEIDEYFSRIDESGIVDAIKKGAKKTWQAAKDVVSGKAVAKGLGKWKAFGNKREFNRKWFEYIGQFGEPSLAELPKMAADFMMDEMGLSKEELQQVAQIAPKAKFTSKGGIENLDKIIKATYRVLNKRETADNDEGSSDNDVKEKKKREKLQINSKSAGRSQVAILKNVIDAGISRERLKGVVAKIQANEDKFDKREILILAEIGKSFLKSI